MLFSSITFLFYFIPIVILVYYMMPKRLRNGVLLFASLVFYAWGEPKYVLFMLFSVTQGYVAGRLVERYRGRMGARIALALSVVFSLGMLGYFKYADFFISNFNTVTGLGIPLLRVTLPVGISFYTFQIMSYVIDVYRADAKAQKNYVNLATYISMFPQLIAGPIVRYTDLERQLTERTYEMSAVAQGVRRFVLGLGKKILIANVLGELVEINKATGENSVLFLWMYAIACSLQIYYDFSGYSDMAVGLGLILGFHFPENFNYPFIAGSITEFWRRWHMSLGTWFRDYLYIPLGGNRVGTIHWMFNILIVWMATGFWHGASWNFILWGLFFALFLVLEKLFLLRYLKRSHVWKHIYVILLTVVSFVIFDSAELSLAFGNIRALFGGAELPLVTYETTYYLKSYAVILVIGLIGATPLPKYLVNRVWKTRAGEKWNCILEPVVLLAIVVMCTAFLIGGSFNPFLYFRF